MKEKSAIELIEDNELLNKALNIFSRGESYTSASHFMCFVSICVCFIFNLYFQDYYLELFDDGGFKSLIYCLNIVLGGLSGLLLFGAMLAFAETDPGKKLYIVRSPKEKYQSRFYDLMEFNRLFFILGMPYEDIKGIDDLRSRVITEKEVIEECFLTKDFIVSLKNEIKSDHQKNGKYLDKLSNLLTEYNMMITKKQMEIAKVNQQLDYANIESIDANEKDFGLKILEE